MNIAEFFVNLGIKGTDQTKKGLNSVDASLKNMGSNALWAKAGIVAAMWGLERMMSSQNAVGAGMVNFAATTGLSIQKLQEFKYAAQQVNVAGSEVEGSLKGVQNTMIGMLQGQGAPKGLAMLADFMAKTGEAFDPARARDMDYMMENLQKFAQSGPADLLKDKVMSFGVSEAMFGAMRQNAFTPEVMSKAPKYSDKEAKSLANMNAGWSNIGQKIEMGFGHIFAKHGPKLISDIDKIIPKIMQLANALATFAEKMQVFKWIGKAFEGWAMILDEVGTGTDNINKAIEKKGLMGGIGERAEAVGSAYLDIAKGMMASIKESIEPQVRPSTAGGAPKNTTINQTMNFAHPGTDHKKTASSVHKATKAVVQTSPAQTQEH